MRTWHETSRTLAAAAGMALLLASPCFASAASLDIGFDFRCTTGYVTDPADSYIVGSTATYAYPVTNGGTSYGWTTVTGLGGCRDRSTTVDPRLAGVVFRQSGTSAYNDFRVDLPAAGTYTVSIALGDAGSSQSGEYAEIYDGTTLLATVNAAKAGQPQNQFFDSNSVLHTEATFFANQTPLTLDFSTTELVVRLGTANSGSGNDAIAHLEVASIASVPAAAPARVLRLFAGYTVRISHGAIHIF